ncbi:MAG: hypothetical protein KL863_22340 [Rhizobium sp.]|nr:hypothetical protein [Rhizobium sp.]
MGTKRTSSAHSPKNCSLYRDRADFDTITGEIRAALADWQGGRWLEGFAPQFVEPAVARKTIPFSGLGARAMLHFPDNTAGTGTPGELFALMRDMLCRAEDIPIDATALWGAGINLARETTAA